MRRWPELTRPASRPASTMTRPRSGFVDSGGADLLHRQVLDQAEVGVTEIGAFGFRFVEIGAIEFGARQFGAGQVGVIKFGLDQHGFAQVGAHHVGVAQVGAMQVGPGEVGPDQVLPGQIGPVQVFLDNSADRRSETFSSDIWFPPPLPRESLRTYCLDPRHAGQAQPSLSYR